MRAGGPRLPPVATRWAPSTGTVTLQRRARHYYDPDDWAAADDDATSHASGRGAGDHDGRPRTGQPDATQSADPWGDPAAWGA